MSVSKCVCVCLWINVCVSMDKFVSLGNCMCELCLCI